MSNVNKHSPETNILPALEDRLGLATRAFIIWLRALFRFRRAGDYRWHPNPTESDLFISGQEPDEGEPTNRRPRIIVSRGGLRFSGTSTTQIQTHEWASPIQTMSDLAAMSIVVAVTAREGLEAQALSWYISTRMMAFRTQLAKYGRLHSIVTNQITVGTESPQGSVVRGSPDPEFKTVQIQVPVYLQETIRSDETGFYPNVRNLMMTMATESGDTTGSVDINVTLG